MESSDMFLGLHDFLERMRKPSATDFVKSIKSFIVSFSNHAPDPEKDCAAVQEFFSKMEAAFRVHPLWSGCSEEELDSAGEGLEKYVMTKLFSRVFASNPEEIKYDEQLFEKMALVQHFISPENLDIKPTYQNESSWLLAQKELQKINMYKAPRDKLVCILNCCKVINNLLFNASVDSNENAPGADEFLPVLIYVTIKANPPQLHSNLLYIERYRRQSKLVGEAAYFFTNMMSAESFISNIDAKSISMEEIEFETNMEFARSILSGSDNRSNRFDQKIQTLSSNKEKDDPQSLSSDNLSIKKAESLLDLENKGADLLLKDSGTFREYSYVFARAGDLTISDVEDLLSNYKQLVLKYVCLCKGLKGESEERSFTEALKVEEEDDVHKLSHEDESTNRKASQADEEEEEEEEEDDDSKKQTIETKAENEDHSSKHSEVEDKAEKSEVLEDSSK